MIGEFSTAIVNGLTIEDLGKVIRPHPTYGEAITEVIEDVDNHAIHILPKGLK
jgi:dihydrolipoamide dehydrogenase